MTKKKIKASKLTVNLPFNLGHLEFEPDEVQQRAAWELYVELSTRIATQPIAPGEGLLREALTSLYSLFDATRDVLRRAGPSVATGPNSLGPVAVDILNKGLRPFLAKWHPLLQSWEQTRISTVSPINHERSWEKEAELREELENLRAELTIYCDALAMIAGVKRD